LNCSTPQTVSVQPNANSGIALLKIAVIPNSPFQKIAKTAILTISASDMLSMTKSLTITDSSVEGKVSGIPVGKNRLFEVSVFDSLDTLQYQGSATSDVISDSMVTVFISVKRITSSANINGNIIEDTTNSIGYRYYKFVVNASNIGSSPGAAEDVSILTETHFLKGSVAYPPAGNYSIVSDSSVEAGSVAALFDGDSATDSTGNYMKFTLAPWAWVIDMKQNYTFDNFYLSSWQTYWYREPSDIAIYGANSSSGPWKQIGAEVFTAVYQAAVVPLVY
jgi:hypothetical protein